MAIGLLILNVEIPYNILFEVRWKNKVLKNSNYTHEIHDHIVFGK